MRLKSLHLQDFRNLRQVQLKFPERLCFFSGENAQGKTNLLESIYLLCRGESFRPMATGACILHGAEQARWTASLTRRGLDFAVSAEYTNAKKRFLVNRKPVTSQYLRMHFPVVLFSPESLSSIKGGPEERRQLLDELVTLVAPQQVPTLREFDRCLRSRNRLLRQLARDEGDREEHLRVLASIDQIFLVLATHVVALRLQSLRTLLPLFGEAFSWMDSAHGDILVEYLISGQNALSWTETQVFDAMHARQKELASAERSSGQSLVGPSKHELRFLFAGNDSRFFCSQGQQRGLILAFKMAQIVYHHKVHQTYPLLLLDDVLSELDERRRESLMSFLQDIAAQVFLTSTDVTKQEAFATREQSQIYVVEGGHVRPLQI